MTTPITVAYGDAHGPALMQEVLLRLRAVKADISIETIEVGERVYAMDGPLGILPYALESLNRTRVLLKAPTAKPPEGFTEVSDAIISLLQLETADRYSQHGYDAYITDSFAFFDVREQTTDLQPLLLAAAHMLTYLGFKAEADQLCAAGQALSA